MRLSLTDPLMVKRHEVPHVLCYEGPTLDGGQSEQLGVGDASKQVTGRDRLHVRATATQRIGYRRGVHLVEE